MTSPFVLDPNAGAAAALTGDEAVAVMQGGYPKQTTAQEIADLAGGAAGYSAKGTYSPTITNGDGTTTLGSPLVWARWGNGPGPQAGDCVRVFGFLSASTVDPDTLAFGSFPPPFVMADAAAHATASNYNQSVTSAIATADVDTGLITYAIGGLSTADSPQIVSIGIDFTAENAVDP